MPRHKKEGKKNIRKDISMDPEQYERLMNYCRQQDRPISWVIRQALESIGVSTEEREKILSVMHRKFPM